MTHIEIDEMFGFMGDVGAEVPANNTVPGGVVLFIEFLFDVGGDVLFDVELFEGDVGAVDGILLHFLVHVGMLDDGFPFGCGHNLKNIS